MSQNHPSDTKNHNLPKLKNKNYGSLAVKILCVLAAFILWIYVMAVESPTHERTFSDVVVSLENEKVLKSRELYVYSVDGNKDDYTVKVDITLSGKKSKLSKLESSDIKAYFDLSKKEGSGQSYSEVIVEPIDGCEVVSISREGVYISVDKKIRKVVEIREEFKNLNLPEGYQLGIYDMPADTLSIEGAQRSIENIDYARAVFDLEGITETSVLAADIILIDHNEEDDTETIVNSSSLEFDRVEMKIPIEKEVEIPVEVVFKYGYLNEENSEISLSADTVTVTGEPAAFEDADLLEPIIIDEKLDFDEDGVYCETIDLVPPEGLIYSEDKLEITVVRDSSLTPRQITVHENNIMESGALDTVKYEISKPDEVKVMLIGPREIITQISPDDITLKLDLSGYGESVKGKIKVKAIVEIDSSFAADIIELGEYTVDVTFLD